MTKALVKYIAYYRVSKGSQAKSGLGLDAQRRAVKIYLKKHKGKIIHNFTEVESGGKNNRPELKNALKLCKENNCTLIIAQLDRLSRNVAFISSLMESEVEFICADMPEADKFTIHIFAALAQKEREMISVRIKNSLKQAKERGVKLGWHNPKIRKAIKQRRKNNKKVVFKVPQ